VANLLIGSKIRPKLTTNEYELILEWNAGVCRHFFLEEDESYLKKIGDVLLRHNKLAGTKEGDAQFKEEMKNSIKGTALLHLVPSPPPFKSLQLIKWQVIYYDFEGNQFNVSFE
jgi:hypothetical protein